MHATTDDPLFFEGMHYDLKWRRYTADLPFWARQVKKFGQPVLELACGTGRVSIQLAMLRYRVTGIDPSESLLRDAIRKALRLRLAVEWVNGDIRSFDLKTTFPLVIFPFNSIALLSEPKDLEACFACVKRHLAPQGRFVIDFFNPNLEMLSRDPAKRFPHARYPAPNGTGTVEVTESDAYDAAQQINHVRLFHKFPGTRGELVEETKIRIFFPQELNALLRYNGFLVEEKYGDYDESPFDAQSLRQLIVCSLAS